MGRGTGFDRPANVRESRGMRTKPVWLCITAVLLLLGAICGQAYATESQPACVRFVSDMQFTDIAGSPGPISADGGVGVEFELSPVNQQGKLPGFSIGRRGLNVFDRGQRIHHLAESFYVSLTCVARGSATYWVVEEYTGGTHCCNRHHFFSKSGPHESIRYVGSSFGTMNPLDNPWVCRGKNLYFEDSDVRFVAFHTKYAGSRLYIPRFYRLTPSSVVVHNRTFRDVYRDEIAEINWEIEEKARSRTSKVSAIVSKTDDRPFSDELGQLIVQKTILYLFSGEKRKAWETFIRDIKSHYETTEGADILKREIEKLLKETPY